MQFTKRDESRLLNYEMGWQPGMLTGAHIDFNHLAQAMGMQGLSIMTDGKVGWFARHALLPVHRGYRYGWDYFQLRHAKQLYSQRARVCRSSKGQKKTALTGYVFSC